MALGRLSTRVATPIFRQRLGARRHASTSSALDGIAVDVCTAVSKFEEAVNLALGENHGVPRPPELEILFTLDRRRSTVSNDVDAVKSMVKRRMIGAGSSILYSINISTVMTIGSLGFMAYSIFTK